MLKKVRRSIGLFAYRILYSIRFCPAFLEKAMNFLHVLSVLLNFFFLSDNDEECARYHGDRHLHKMIVEHAQILSYVWHNTNPNHEFTKKIYKGSKGHQKHPVVLWAQKSKCHYRKIVSITKELCREREKRGFTKTHKTEAMIDLLAANEPPNLGNESSFDGSFVDEGWQDPPSTGQASLAWQDPPSTGQASLAWQDPPKCMPEEYHVDQNGYPYSTIDSYRLLYAGDKIEIAKIKWEPKSREPEWLDEFKKRVQSRPDILKGISERKKKSDEAKKKKRVRNQRKRELSDALALEPDEELQDAVESIISQYYSNSKLKSQVPNKKIKMS